MKTSSFILIPATQFGTANENYDPLVNNGDFSGIPQKAAAYYSKDKSVQTLSWNLTNFVGVLTIEATLDALSDTDNYFPIMTVDASGGPSTIHSWTNDEGNYTWIRATITSFTAGSIGKVVIGY